VQRRYRPTDPPSPCDSVALAQAMMQTRSKVNGNAEKEPSFGRIPRGRDEHEHREAVSHHGSNDRSIPVSFFVGVVAIVCGLAAFAFGVAVRSQARLRCRERSCVDAYHAIVAECAGLGKTTRSPQRRADADVRRRHRVGGCSRVSMARTSLRSRPCLQHALCDVLMCDGPSRE
jgi:hypothetical protein